MIKWSKYIMKVDELMIETLSGIFASTDVGEKFRKWEIFIDIKTLPNISDYVLKIYSEYNIFSISQSIFFMIPILLYKKEKKIRNYNIAWSCYPGINKILSDKHDITWYFNK